MHIRLRDTKEECAKEDVANSLPEAENMLKAHEDLKVRTVRFIPRQIDKRLNLSLVYSIVP